MSWILVLLGICALIVLHEGGHFGAAKLVGMRVERFSLFFGPMWLKRTIGETEYGVGVIPLGGFVKITGMSPEDVYDDPEVEARAYVNQPVWKRIVVIAAGPLVNIIVAFLIFAGVLFIHGYYPTNVTVLSRVALVDKGSAAAGVVHAGDVIVSMDGRTNRAAEEKVVAASTCAGGAHTNGCVASPAVKLVVRRAGKLVSFAVHPRYNRAAGRTLIGIEYAVSDPLIKPSFARSAHLGVSQIWSEVSGTVSRLEHIYQAKDRRQFHSIAGAATIAEEATNQSTAEGVSVLGSISLALAIVNLLPFLPLDGGHIFWALVEKVRKRKVTLATMERASYIGLALVLCLFAIGFSNDISTFIHGGHFLRGN